MNTLFIGGPADGKWIDIEKHIPSFLIVNRQHLDYKSLNNDNTPISNIEFKEYEYKRESLAFMDKRYSVMVFVENDRNVIETLINGYIKQEHRDLVELDKEF